MATSSLNDIKPKSEFLPSAQIQKLSLGASLATTPESDTGENKEREEYNKQQGVRLAAFRTEQALKKEARKQAQGELAKQRASLLRDRLAEDLKENDELQTFEVEQLQYLAARMNQNHHRTLASLATKEVTTYDPGLQTLLTAINGSTRFLGSSHFEILVPDTRKRWLMDAHGEYQNIPMVRRVGWTHNNSGGHSNSDLQPRAKGRCLAATNIAGLKQARFQAALAAQTSQRRRIGVGV